MIPPEADPFRIADDMQKSGWKIRWRNLPAGLGHGCVDMTVERDGVSGHATAERFGDALDRAIKRRERELTRNSKKEDGDEDV